MPDEIGISVSYPLPGTKFYENVKDQLKTKSNWADSDELALMFRNTFPPSYYKRLHRYVHKVYRKRTGFNSIKNILLNPLSINLKNLRSAILTFYYIPASILDSFLLKKLETTE
jgi:anaerobic magnesium-protoporphyrin IX monomethyl ester cyclase